jgi:hypothetical protein
MPYSGMLRRVALIRTDVSVEGSVTIIRVIIFICTLRRLLLTAKVVLSSDSCHPDEGGVMFLRTVGSYKSHMA